MVASLMLEVHFNIFVLFLLILFHLLIIFHFNWNLFSFFYFKIEIIRFFFLVRFIIHGLNKDEKYYLYYMLVGSPLLVVALTIDSIK